MKSILKASSDRYQLYFSRGNDKDPSRLLILWIDCEFQYLFPVAKAVEPNEVD